MEKNAIPEYGQSFSASARCLTNLPVRILVVDDDETIRRVSAGALSRFGYQTETAEDGAAAWEVLQANEYHLLITDWNMPKVSGLELVRKVRFARMTLPVILASGGLPTQELNQNLWLQPVALLAKPFSSGQLLATVNEILMQSTISPALREFLPVNCQA